MFRSRWRVTVRPFRPGTDSPLLLVTAIPDSELMAGAHALLQRLILALVTVILAAIPITLGLARKISRDLHKLAHEAEGIRRFDFAQPIVLRSMITEVDDLAQTMDAMKETIRRFIDVTHAIADEKDFDRLLPRLLSETIAAADAGAAEPAIATAASVCTSSRRVSRPRSKRVTRSSMRCSMRISLQAPVWRSKV